MAKEGIKKHLSNLLCGYYLFFYMFDNMPIVGLAYVCPFFPLTVPVFQRTHAYVAFEVLPEERHIGEIQ